MSPRPRQVSDEEFLQAAFRAIARLGPSRLRLADVGEEAGVSAAAVVHRFGSRRGLLLAAAADAASGTTYIFDGLRARHRSPVRAILGLADCMALLGTTPEEIANTLAFLRLDLTEADFHRHALEGSRAMHAGIRELVEGAVAADELVPCPAKRLASALQATMNGSQLNWAVHREGAMTAWIRRDLETVLQPYRVVRRKT